MPDAEKDEGDTYVKYVGWVGKDKLEQAKSESEKRKHMLEG